SWRRTRKRPPYWTSETATSPPKTSAIRPRARPESHRGRASRPGSGPCPRPRFAVPDEPERDFPHDAGTHLNIRYAPAIIRSFGNASFPGRSHSRKEVRHDDDARRWFRAARRRPTGRRLASANGPYPAGWPIRRLDALLRPLLRYRLHGLTVLHDTTT